MGGGGGGHELRKLAVTGQCEQMICLPHSLWNVISEVNLLFFLGKIIVLLNVFRRSFQLPAAEDTPETALCCSCTFSPTSASSCRLLPMLCRIRSLWFSWTCWPGSLNRNHPQAHRGWVWFPGPWSKESSWSPEKACVTLWARSWRAKFCVLKD